MRRAPDLCDPLTMRRLLVPLSMLVAMAAGFALATLALRALAPPAESPIPALLQPPARTDASAQPPPLPDVDGAARIDGSDTHAIDTRRALAEAAERAEEAARAAVVGEATRVDEPLEVRLDLYWSALTRALEASGNPALLAHKGVWTEHFLRLEPVQTELAALSPEARGEALAQIRRQIGFDEASVQRMAERDRVRDARWERGLSYLEERRRLEATFEGEVLTAELRHLREEVFGHEAATIEREEASGFERFERRRVYGRN